MHLSMLSPTVGGGGGGNPREYDIVKLSQGRDFDDLKWYAGLEI